jgi:MYXO-CTERM domain-containing protein
MNAPLLPSLAIAGFVLGANVYTEPLAAQTEERVTRSAAGPVTDRAADELRDPTSFEIIRRQPNEIAVKPRVSGKGFDSLKATYGDSWIYDATTDLFSDRDDDGYYRYLRVRFDADTIYTFSYVYAEIYLSADGTAWEHLYSTDDFAIWGSDPDDDYEVETELVSGYSTGLYDVLIELYDADTGELVDEFGPNESPEFSLLPLEDSARDGLIAPLPDSHSHGGGGAVSWLGLVGLLGALALRRRRLSA